MIKKIIWSLIILLAIIDLIVIGFYVKTRERIDYIQNHHFTQSLQKNQKNSSDNVFKAVGAKHTIKLKKALMSQSMDIIESKSSEISKLSEYRIYLFTVEDIYDILKRMVDYPDDHNLMREAAERYN